MPVGVRASHAQARRVVAESRAILQRIHRGDQPARGIENARRAVSQRIGLDERTICRVVGERCAEAQAIKGGDLAVGVVEHCPRRTCPAGNPRAGPHLDIDPANTAESQQFRTAAEDIRFRPLDVHPQQDAAWLPAPPVEFVQGQALDRDRRSRRVRHRKQGLEPKLVRTAAGWKRVQDLRTRGTRDGHRVERARNQFTTTFNSRAYHRLSSPLRYNRLTVARNVAEQSVACFSEFLPSGTKPKTMATGSFLPTRS